MKNVLRLLGVVFMAAALAAMLSGCPSPTGVTNDDNGKDPVNPPKPPVEQGPSMSGNNINFGTLSADLSQAEISERIDTAMGYLADQAEGIRSDYEARQEYMQLHGLSRPAMLADFIRREEKSIVDSYGGIDVGMAKSNANSSTVNIVRESNNAGGAETDTTNLFARRVSAFRIAQRLAQRRHGDTSTIEAQLNTLCQHIENYGGTAPQGTPAAQAASLRADLTATIPAICGEPELRNKLIQQWEDMAQFEGWTEDIAALGKQVTRGAARSMSYDAANNTVTMGK